MLITKLQGGLGNQLFQYAMGRAVSAQLKTTLLFDVSYYSYVKNRHYILDSFQAIGKKLRFFDSPLFFFVTLPVVGAWYEKIYRTCSLGNVCIVREKKYYVYEPTAISGKENLYLDGFWQHWRYIEPIKHELRRELAYTRPHSKELQRLLSKMKGKSSVSVHVRRGDYTNHSVFLPCSLNYYKAASKKILKSVKNVQFFVFSDDIRWAQEHMKFLPKATFVQNLNGELEDFHAMRLCKHHIVANSTFSWWAAWLGDGGTTIVPKKWFRDDQYPSDGMICEDWISL